MNISNFPHARHLSPSSSKMRAKKVFVEVFRLSYEGLRTTTFKLWRVDPGALDLSLPGSGFPGSLTLMTCKEQHGGIEESNSPNTLSSCIRSKIRITSTREVRVVGHMCYILLLDVWRIFFRSWLPFWFRLLGSLCQVCCQADWQTSCTNQATC